MATQTAPNTIRDRLLKGIALQQAGEFEKAQRIYKQAVKKAPNNADAVHLLGVTYRQLGYPTRALEYIQKAIALNPNQSVFYANLARAMMDMGSDVDSLLAVCNKALSLNPLEREARNIKGIALTKKKEFEEAELIFQSLIVEDPEYKDAYRNFGTLLMDADRANHAVNFYIKAVMLEPDNPENYLLRARARLKLKQYEPSQYELTEALERFPDNADVKHEAARLLFSMNESNLAVFYAKQAHEADPRDYHKGVTYGVNLLMHGDHKEALRIMKKAKKSAPPSNRTVDWNLALAYLANGDLKNGWELHSARFEDPAAQILRRTFEIPEWKGEDISDKTILVWADQGLGDALKAGTMLPELIARAGKVIVELSEKGAKFTQYCFPEAESRLAQMDSDNFQTAFDYDLHVNIGELVKFFRPTIESFKTAPCPVYSFEKDRAVEYLKRLKGNEDKPVIGFSWRSKNLAVNRARYYLSAPGIAPLLESRDAIFVNLQYAALEKEINFLKERAGDRFIDLEDVDLFDDLLGAAALTAACDFVVSANTSVADIAGILDVPAIRFGQQEPPLLLGQKNPPWYPSMTYMHPYTDKACAEFVPEIIKEMDRQLENWTPERRNKRLGL
ncbi:tetratricopeptide repeat protein [Roseibium alexandrii]|uniref:Tfp pilus assembly protein PilF n=1 Tax=Roseibium alexandrii (strain DSM 17067 / NCIMB 14079 / DFL-11) TaxID=244592 RepID=A0A5E8GUB1_ROSAD|nr:tetratricopeptide repeat protein [Roseibium alexandrii]EEE43456.1 Tfp pilus assembly protein PilF [Roseibium alexandrii DFL-11]